MSGSLATVCQGFIEFGVQGFKGYGVRVQSLLRGSRDLVTRGIIKVTILIITYNPT